MKKVFLILLLASSSLFGQAPGPQSQQTEPPFAERQFGKKRLRAAETVDNMMLISMIALALSDWSGHPLLNKHNRKALYAMMSTNLLLTLRRMQLYNRYVGLNPFKMIPSFLYFKTVDLLDKVGGAFSSVAPFLFKVST